MGWQPTALCAYHGSASVELLRPIRYIVSSRSMRGGERKSKSDGAAITTRCPPRCDDKFASKTCETGAHRAWCAAQLMRRCDRAMLIPMGWRRRFRGHRGDKSS